MNFQMFKLDLDKAEEPEIKLPTSVGSSKKQESSRKNIYFYFTDHATAFDCVDHKNLWKILLEMEIPDHFTCLLRNMYTGQEATVRTGHGATDCFQIRKGVHQGYVHCHSAYSTYMQSVSWKMPGRMKPKLESRLLGEISTSDLQVTPLLWQKVRRN